MSQLYKIADAVGEKRANLIFVHGLGGDPYTTWRYGPGEDGFWPKWLATDAPGLAIYSLGYEAAVSRWRGAAMHLPDRAKNVLEQFLVYPDLAQGPLYLVGHSLGGLVIKQLLRTAESEAKFRPEAADFLARVEKVAFFGTPHAGAGQATLGDRLRILVRPSEATSSLVRNDPYLRNLNNWYRDWVNSRAVPHLILSETRPTRILGMLVPPDSSDPGLANVHAVPIGATHIGICKPSDKNHEIYLQARAFIERVARPQVDPIIAKVDKLPDEIVAKLLSELENRGGLKKAEGDGLERETIIALAQRIKPDESLDFDRAIAELESAVTVALDVIAKGKRGTNQGDLINNVLARVAEQTKAGQFDQAAKQVDAGLAELDRHETEHQEEMRRARLTLLHAGIAQDILRRDAPSVARRAEQAVAIEHPDDATARFAALRAKQNEFYVEGRDKGVNFSLEIAIELARRTIDIARDENQRGAAQNDLGVALVTLGERESGTARLDEAVEAYREALKQYTRERVPLDWAMTQNNLGNALASLGERESGAARLDEAVAAYREALKEHTRARVPLDWAMTQNNLANALTTLGARQSGTTRLDEAVGAYRAALKEYTRERVPLDWAATQNNLGNALQTIGERESGTARLDEAVAAFREALKERTRKRVPLYWAATQNNLGNALQTLGARESGTARLKEAVAAHREALKEFTRERVPRQWATTQNNLGSALQTLGARENGTARLEEAVAAFREALKEYARERLPLDWAMSTGNQGVAFMRLADRRGDAATAAKAVSQIDQALAMFREGGHVPFAQYLEARLPEARAIRDRLNKA